MEIIRNFLKNQVSLELFPLIPLSLIPKTLAHFLRLTSVLQTLMIQKMHSLKHFNNQSGSLNFIDLFLSLMFEIQNEHLEIEYRRKIENEI